MARKGLIPPHPPPTDGEVVLRMQRESDVAAIAEATHDPETLRRLDDVPLTPERQRGSVSRAQERWKTGAGAPFVPSPTPTTTVRSASSTCS